jgi:hypothetical protein
MTTRGVGIALLAFIVLNGVIAVAGVFQVSLAYRVSQVVRDDSAFVRNSISSGTMSNASPKIKEIVSLSADMNDSMIDVVRNYARFTLVSLAVSAINCVVLYRLGRQWIGLANRSEVLDVGRP